MNEKQTGVGGVAVTIILTAIFSTFVSFSRIFLGYENQTFLQYVKCEIFLATIQSIFHIIIYNLYS